MRKNSKTYNFRIRSKIKLRRVITIFWLKSRLLNNFPFIATIYWKRKTSQNLQPSKMAQLTFTSSKIKCGQRHW